MRLYFNKATGRLITKPGYTGDLSALRVKRGDAVTLELEFYDGGTKSSIVGSDIVFVVKQSVASEVLAIATVWSESDGVYTADLDTNTQEILDAIGVTALLGAKAELTFSEDGGTNWMSSQTIQLNIESDLYRDNEMAPVSLGGKAVLARTEVASNADKLLEAGVRDGQEVEITGEGHRLERYLGAVEAPDYLYMVYGGNAYVLKRKADEGGFVAYQHGTLQILLYRFGDVWFMDDSVAGGSWNLTDADGVYPWDGDWENDAVAGPAGDGPVTRMVALYPSNLVSEVGGSEVLGARDPNGFAMWDISENKLRANWSGNGYKWRWEASGTVGAGWYVYDGSGSGVAFSGDAVEFPWLATTWLLGVDEDHTPLAIRAPEASAWEDNWMDVVPSYEVYFTNGSATQVSQLNGVDVGVAAEVNVGWMRPGHHRIATDMMGMVITNVFPIGGSPMFGAGSPQGPDVGALEVYGDGGTKVWFPLPWWPRVRRLHLDNSPPV